MLATKKAILVRKPVLEPKRLVCTYEVNGGEFTNFYAFPEAVKVKNPLITEKLCAWLAVISSFGLFSIDYFSEVICDFELSGQETEFFEKLIFQGFGEFRFINQIPIKTRTKVIGLPATSSGKFEQLHKSASTLNPLLLNGGGKDGSVSALLLSELGVSFTWFQRGDSAAQANIAKVWGRPSIIVKRVLDSKRKNRKYSGHRPMSAGIACLAVLSAYLYGHDAVIASNEASANEGNFTLQGFKLNHQYSKGLEFEQDFQKLLDGFAVPVKYFSLLRPLHELQIACLATNLEDEQLAAITSCNNGTRDAHWCLNCAKCAFVALVMMAASPEVAIKVWGKQVINTPSLRKYFIELLDPAVDKPLECVGTLEECQRAAGIVLKRSPDLIEPELKTIFKRYALVDNKDSEDFITTLGQSSIPAGYKQAVPLMRRHLSEWNEQSA